MNCESVYYWHYDACLDGGLDRSGGTASVWRSRGSGFKSLVQGSNPPYRTLCGSDAWVTFTIVNNTVCPHPGAIFVLSQYTFIVWPVVSYFRVFFCFYVLVNITLNIEH